MEIIKTASAGTLESSDIMITLEPQSEGISIDLESSVEKQFGQQIRQVIQETLNMMNIKAAHVNAVDKGALDCTVQARMVAAIARAAETDFRNWKEL
ncbi:citrate lyase acyl carrier protein [Ignavigranum ruoffiae]|uniref:citrate lyase acyl carrier protein n=1 Tax=Ignavigranum ruoffiae TaxID=89093 RepID=UPI0024AD2DF4|nr:citrate lyase acyl carrier protein [Ignavigranum ruoffiae]